MNSKLYKKIFVGLELNTSDNSIISFVKRYNYAFSPSQYFFSNTQNNINQRAFINDSTSPLETILQKKIELENNFQPNGIKFYYSGLKANPSEQIIKQSKNQGLDLLILSRKSNLDDKGITPRHISRNVHSDVLIIPNAENQNYTSALVLVDGSETSISILKKAIKLCVNMNMDLHVEHYYNIPEYLLNTSDLSFKEVAQNLREKRKLTIDEILTHTESEKITTYKRISLLDDNDIPHQVLRTAQKLKNPIIICGSKNLKERLSSSLGLVTETLLELNYDYPQLIIKH